MDYCEAQEVKEIMAVKRYECPCGEPLEHFSGLFLDGEYPRTYIPEHYQCPKCLKQYSSDGERIGRIE